MKPSYPQRYFYFSLILLNDNISLFKPHTGLEWLNELGSWIT